MITAEQIRARHARCYSFDRRVYDRAERARKRQAIGLELSLDVATGAVVGTKVVTPASIFGVNPAWWLDASAGTLTDAGAGACSAWADSSPNGRNFVQATGANRGTIIATGLNSKKTIRFTTSQFMTMAGYTMPQPSVTMSYFTAIVKPVTNNINTVLLGIGSGSSCFQDSGNRLVGYDGTIANSSPALTAGTWYRVEVLFSNQATDYAAIGGTAGTLASGGNNVPSAGMSINANSSGTQGANFEFAELLMINRASVPTTTERSKMAAYFLAKWGVS